MSWLIYCLGVYVRTSLKTSVYWIIYPCKIKVFWLDFDFDLLAKPDINITMCGWRIESGVPHPCIWGDTFAPPELMEVVACGCSSQSACSRNTCSCKAAGFSYTSFCKCQASNNCHNPHIKHQDNYSD